MKPRTKMLALGTAAILAGAFGWNALAETSAGSGAAPMHATGAAGMGSHMGSGMMGRVFADPSGYLASIKQDLRITEAEGPAWDAYAKAVQDAVAPLKSLHDSTGMKEMHDATNGPTVMAQLHDQHRQAYEKLRTAADQLVASLDEGQKQKARGTLAGLASGEGGMTEHLGMMEHMGMMGNGATR